MKSAGAVLVDPRPSSGSDYESTELEVLLYELLLTPSPGRHARRRCGRWLTSSFNEQNRDVRCRSSARSCSAGAGGGRSDSPAHKKALANNQRSRARRVSTPRSEAHRRRWWRPPAGRPGSPTGNGDHFTGVASTPPAVAGYPAITVPAGFIFGLLTVTPRRAWSEATLIKLAYARAADAAAHATVLSLSLG
jgi:amidase